MKFRLNPARTLRRHRASTASPYGPDPGDASVEHALAGLLEEIREDADQLRRYPNAGTARKSLMLAGADAGDGCQSVPLSVP